MTQSSCPTLRWRVPNLKKEKKSSSVQVLHWQLRRRTTLWRFFLWTKCLPKHVRKGPTHGRADCTYRGLRIAVPMAIGAWVDAGMQILSGREWKSSEADGIPPHICQGHRWQSNSPPPNVIGAFTVGTMAVLPLTNQTTEVRGHGTPTTPTAPPMMATTPPMTPMVPTTPGGTRTMRPRPKPRLIRKLVGALQK